MSEVIEVNALTEQEEYKAVCKVIQNLDRADILEKLSGNCVSAADLIQSALDVEGVRSRILECSLVVTQVNKADADKQKHCHFIGFSFLTGNSTANSVDTHVIVLVEAEIPFIVDASIGYVFDNLKFVIVAPLSSKDPDIIADQQTEDYTLTYRTKKNIRLTDIHQKTLLERTMTDQRTRKDVSRLGLLVRVLIAVGVFNMLANTWLVVLKFMYP